MSFLNLAYALMTENVEGLFVSSHSEALLEYGKYCVVFALAADGQWTDGSNLIPEHGIARFVRQVSHSERYPSPRNLREITVDKFV